MANPILAGSAGPGAGGRAPKSRCAPTSGRATPAVLTDAFFVCDVPALFPPEYCPISDLSDAIKALENDAQYLRDNLPNLDDPPTTDQLTLIQAFIGTIQERLDRVRELTPFQEEERSHLPLLRYVDRQELHAGALHRLRLHQFLHSVVVVVALPAAASER